MDLECEGLSFALAVLAAANCGCNGGMSLHVGLKISELLDALEKTPEVLDFRFQHDQILMWPFVRVALLHGALFEAYGLNNPFAKNEKLTLRGYSSYILQTVMRNPFTGSQRRGSAIVMFATGITNVLRGGRYVNRVHDLLASENADQTLLIEDSCRKKYLRPRCYQNLKYHDLIPILSIFESKVTSSDSRDEPTISEFVSFLKSCLPYRLRGQIWNEVEALLLSKSRRLRSLHRYYDLLFDKLKPELVFVEDGSYGPKGIIFRWAKRRGIITAELQHGLVSENHPAYNYGGALLASPEYISYLPDYFLVYGPYWSSKVNTPSKKEIIGNPNLSEYLAPVRTANPKKVILIVSGGTIPKAVRRIVLDLPRILDLRKYEIRLRPHPGEIPLIKERYDNLEHLGVQIDLCSDVCQSVSQADFVAGEVSTTLFEALFFGKTVFLMDHPYSSLHIDRGVFPMFESASDLARLIEEGSFQMPESRSFWAEDWKHNYARFIATTQGQKPVADKGFSGWHSMESEKPSDVGVAASH